MNTQNSKPKDKDPALSASKYLWLQHEKKRLDKMEMDIVRMQYRQDRQAGWIILLLICMMVLMIAVLFALTT